MNHGADNNADTIADLEYLNFHSVANQLRDFNTIYSPNGVPVGAGARQEALDEFDEDPLEEFIEKMDNAFWDVSNDSEKVLLEYINNSGIGH
jgi:hypothetical protein